MTVETHGLVDVRKLVTRLQLHAILVECMEIFSYNVHVYALYVYMVYDWEVQAPVKDITVYSSLACFVVLMEVKWSINYCTKAFHHAVGCMHVHVVALHALIVVGL